VNNHEQNPVDGFVYSASMLYLPTTYRASALAQMEVLRLAKGYRPRWYLIPEDSDQPVGLYSQIEFQVRVQPGAYLWAISFSTLNLEGPLQAFVQVTDACTETPLFSDYLMANLIEPSTGAGRRNPLLLTPRLIGEPGLLNVEIYNSYYTNLTPQLMLLVAEPFVPPMEMDMAIREAGLERILE